MSALAKHQQPDMFPDSRELGRAIGVLTQKFIWYYPNLAPLAGGHKAALMLGGLVNWSRYLYLEAPQRNGWIWKTQQEWQQETGLSRHEQDSARKALLALGLIEQAKRGMPARMFYRVNLQGLGARLSEMLECQFEAWDWNNSAQILKLLGRPINFYVQLAKITDSATCSLLLSYYISSQRGSITTALTADWINSKSAGIEQRLGISYKTQLHARKQLASMGLLDQRMSSAMNPKAEVRLRFSRMLDLLSAKTQAKAELSTGLHHSGAGLNCGDQGFTFSANKEFPNRQTGNAQTGKQGIPFSADKECPNRQTSLPKRETSIYTITNKPQLQHHAESGKQEQAQGQDLSASVQGGGCGGLSISLSGKQPETASHPQQARQQQAQPLQPSPALDFSDINPQWLQADVLSAIGTLPQHLQQAVVDEWAGRFELPKLQYPLRFLDKLIEVAKVGQFRPELGFAVAQRRKSRQQAQARQTQIEQLSLGRAQMPKAANSQIAGSAEATTAGDESAKRAGLARLAELKESFKGKAVSSTNGGQGGVVLPHPHESTHFKNQPQQDRAQVQNTALVRSLDAGRGVVLPPPHESTHFENQPQQDRAQVQNTALVRSLEAEGGVSLTHPHESTHFLNKAEQAANCRLLHTAVAEQVPERGVELPHPNKDIELQVMPQGSLFGMLRQKQILG